MTKLEQLEKKFLASEKALREARDASSEEYTNLLATAAKHIRAAVDAKHGPTITALQVVRDADNKALLEAREVAALSGEGAPFPIGTKVTRPEYKGDCWRRKPVELFGVIEAVTAATRFPTNTPDYRRPKIGQFIVRYLKADGSVGSKFDAPWEWCATSWKAVNGTPNAAPVKKLRVEDLGE